MKRFFKYISAMLLISIVVAIIIIVAILAIFQYGICNNIPSETIFNGQLITIIGILAAFIVISNIGQVLYIKSTFDEKAKNLEVQQIK